MRATIMYRAGDVRVENVPDATIANPTDALVCVTRACICGSDLWPYKDLAPTENGRAMGHEAIGVVEAVGDEVRKVKKGDFVVMPFAYSDGDCPFCEEGLQTSCVHGGFFGNGGEAGGAQAEALRIPQADGTLFALPVAEDDTLMPALLTLSDVMGTGHHAAVTANVRPGNSVAIMGRHPDRIALAKEFGATDVVSERGDEAIAKVRELTGGFGVHAVLECVGASQAIETALGIVRPGGAIGRVGVPHYGPIDLSTL